MELILSLLASLNSLSPLAVIGLLGVIIFLLVKGKTATDGKVEAIASNHLHDMPELVAVVREMNETLRRIELKMEGEFSYIRSRLNGK